ncbi:MAG: TonB-dependent receptor [Mucilaginibacter sp.]|nr:TonB-dependent receptor [Mucilaginibacter sp.]
MEKYTIAIKLSLFRIMKYTFYIFIVTSIFSQLLMAKSSAGQTVRDVHIDLDVKNKTLKEVLAAIQQKSGFQFVYNEQLVSPYYVSYTGKNKTVEIILNSVLNKTLLAYKEQQSKLIIVEKPIEARPVSAQSAIEKTITGTVTDNNGETLPGVTIKIKGTTKGTQTDIDGKYNIKVPDNTATLVFSFIGYETQEVIVGNQMVINIKLNAEAHGLNEVVVIGYGTKAVRENTGSIGKITGEKVSNEPLPSFNEALAGKTAGLQVSMNGGALADPTSIRIRGVNSISSSSQPLIVIDGIPQINEGNLNRIRAGGGTRFDPLALLNSNDIESIEVLKDAGAAVIYGSRASNGVILVTTKKGKSGTAKVSLDSKFGWSEASKKPPVLNGSDYITIQNEKALNRYGAASPNAIIAKSNDINGDGVPDNVNWMDLLYKQGKTYDNSVSFSGGSEKATVFGSARYITQEGIVIPNKLTTGQARLNIDVTPQKWFKGGISLSYGRTLNTGVLTDGYVQGVNISGWQAPSNVSPYNPSGPYGFNLTPGATGGYLGAGNNTTQIGGSSITSNNWFNLIAMSALTRNENTANDTRFNIYGELKLLKGLSFTSKFGIEYLGNFEDQYTNPAIGFWGVPYNGLLLYYTTNWSEWVWQNYFNYSKLFGGKHKLTAVAGTEYQHNHYQAYSTGAANLADPFFNEIVSGSFTNIPVGQTATYDQTNGDVYSSGLISYFSRIGYAYDEKYLVEASFRADAYSAFGAAHQWGYFPSISVGWEATKEKFLANNKILSYLKLRGSYGQVGNSRLSSVYAAQTLYSGAAYGTLNGFNISQVGNPDLRWETSKKTNVGFDATLLQKFNITADYFNTAVDNLILSAPVIATTGVPGTSISTNIGNMRNRGIEFSLNTMLINRKDFNWSTSFNYTHLWNKVLSLVSTNNNADITSGNNVASIGRPLSTYKLINWAGVDPNTGNPTWYAANGTVKEYHLGASGSGLWTDLSGNPVSPITVASDAAYLNKSGLPTWYGGWDNTFTYKSFDLNVSIIYSGGNYIYNSSRASMLSNNVQNNFSAILDRWTTPGQVANVPKLYLGDNTANIASTRFLEKGDFARVRTIALGYTPKKLFLNKFGVSRVRIYAQIFNPFLITKYSGLDPDINTSVRAGSNIAAGTDALGTPQAKTVTLGINVNF